MATQTADCKLRPGSIAGTGSVSDLSLPAQRDGGCVEYQVEHPRWQVWQVSRAEFTCDIARV